MISEFVINSESEEISQQDDVDAEGDDEATGEKLVQSFLFFNFKIASES